MDALNKLSLRGAQRRGNPQNHLKTKSWIASLRSQWRQTRLVQRFPIVPAAAIRLRLCNDPAVSAQVRPLKHRPRRVSSCTAPDVGAGRSEEQTSEIQSLMRISYAVFCLKKTHSNDNT